MTPPMYYYTHHKQPPPHYAGECQSFKCRLMNSFDLLPGLFMQDDANVYTTLEQTMSTNPNVYFQRSQVHPGMIY